MTTLDYMPEPRAITLEPLARELAGRPLRIDRLPEPPPPPAPYVIKNRRDPREHCRALGLDYDWVFSLTPTSRLCRKGGRTFARSRVWESMFKHGVSFHDMANRTMSDASSILAMGRRHGWYKHASERAR